MARYTDELAAIAAAEQVLRRRIAERIAIESGAPSGTDPTPAHVEQAQAAIEAWQHEGEEAQDLRAFRAMGPLQELLAEHRTILDRIDDLQDRRLS